jgi:hypothetical protein
LGQNAEVRHTSVTNAGVLESIEPGARTLLACWVSPGWSMGLRVRDRPEWTDSPFVPEDHTGIAAVLVARAARRGLADVCGFLVDTYCLGVKDALGPRSMGDGRDLAQFTDSYFAAFDDEPVAAPLELAQHLVLGAVAYARRLGFEPHPGFAEAARYLGPWIGPSAITFGRDGRPFYVHGPYDDVPRVLKTLRRTVGRRGFDHD